MVVVVVVIMVVVVAAVVVVVVMVVVVAVVIMVVVVAVVIMVVVVVVVVVVVMVVGVVAVVVVVIAAAVVAGHNHDVAEISHVGMQLVSQRFEGRLHLLHQGWKRLVSRSLDMSRRRASTPTARPVHMFTCSQLRWSGGARRHCDAFAGSGSEFAGRDAAVRTTVTGVWTKRKNAVFLDVTPCGSCKNRHFAGTYRLHNQSEKNRRPRNNIITSLILPPG
jgi:hypothetical protein